MAVCWCSQPFQSWIIQSFLSKDWFEYPRATKLISSCSACLEVKVHLCLQCFMDLQKQKSDLQHYWKLQWIDKWPITASLKCADNNRQIVLLSFRRVLLWKFQTLLYTTLDTVLLFTRKHRIKKRYELGSDDLLLDDLRIFRKFCNLLLWYYFFYFLTIFHLFIFHSLTSFSFFTFSLGQLLVIISKFRKLRNDNIVFWYFV